MFKMRPKDGKCFQYVMLMLLWLNVVIPIVSGMKCSCPKYQKPFSDITISGIEAIQLPSDFARDSMIDSFDIVKNATCSYTWTPAFYEGRIVSPFSFLRLIDLKPCFENNDIISMFVTMEKCCSHSSLHIGSNIRIDTSTANKLNIDIDFDETQHFAMVVKPSTSHRNIPICSSSTSNTAYYTDLDNIDKLHLVNLIDSETVVGWQFVSTENCVVNIFGDDKTTLIVSEISRLFHMNDCFNVDNIHVFPLLGSNDIHCGATLPYHLHFAREEALQRHDITITAAANAIDDNIVTSCSSVDSGESEFSNSLACSDPLLLTEKFDEPCTCFAKQPFVFVEQGVSQIHFEGIPESLNLTFIISNEKGFSQKQFTVEDLETIDLQKIAGAILEPMDMFKFLAYAPKCSCNNKLELLVEGLRFDPSQNMQLRLDWNDDSSAGVGRIAPRVEVVETATSPRSLVDIYDNRASCLSSVQYLDPVDATVDTYSRLIEVLVSRFFTDDANVWELWFDENPGCFIHINTGGSLVDAWYNKDPSFSAISTLTIYQRIISEVPDAHSRCHLNDLNVSPYTQLKYFYLVPLKKTDGRITRCFTPYPYKYAINLRSKNPATLGVRWHHDFLGNEPSFGCHIEQIDKFDARICVARPVNHHVCIHMDELCENCLEGYSFDQRRQICLPGVESLSVVYQSVTFNFNGAIREYQQNDWNLGYRLYALDSDRELFVKTDTRNQMLFNELFTVHNLQPNLEYKIQVIAYHKESSTEYVGQSFYFKTTCAPTIQSAMLNSTNVVINFPRYLERAGFYNYTIFDMSSFESAFPLVKHIDKVITSEEASSYEISKLNPGTTYRVDFYFIDATENFRILPCDSFFFETTCNCGPQVGHDAPIVDPSNAVTQKRGLITFKFADNSMCDTGYAIQRQIQRSDGTFGLAESFAPVFSNYKSTRCYSEISPGKALVDDLFRSQLPAGRTYRYDIRGVGMGYLGSPSYVFHTVKWESSISGVVSLGPRVNSIPISDVNVYWSLKDSNGNIVKQGSLVTDSMGVFRIEFYEDLESTVYSAYPVELKFQKTSMMSDGQPLEHVFLCDNFQINCADSVTTVYLQHLEFDRKVLVVDASVIPVTGKIYVANTPWAEKGCPIAKAQVCLVDRSEFESDSNSTIACVESAADGSYGLPGPIGARVAVVATHEISSHILEFVPASSKFSKANVSIDLKDGATIEGLNFQDVTMANLNVTVAGGWCDLYLGEASLLFTIEGCAWRGISTSQNTVTHGYALPAQNVRVEVLKISQREDILLGTQVADLRDKPRTTEDIYEAEKIQNHDFHTRFQYDGKPIIDVVFSDNMNSECSNTVNDQLVVLPFETIMRAYIFMSRDLGAGLICDDVDPSTRIRIDNGLGLLTESPSDQEYKDKLASFLPPEIMELFVKCTNGCALNMTRDFDPVTQRYRRPKVEFDFGTGRPSILAPYTKLFTVTPIEPGSKQYVAEVVVVGQYKISDKYSVALPTHEPILIIRDPPGGGSSSFYQNVQTTVRVENFHHEAYTGIELKGTTGLAGTGEGGTCAGFALVVCVDLWKAKLKHGFTTKDNKQTLTDLHHAQHTGEFSTTWSYKTSSDQFMVGEPADSFVVPNLNVVYSQTAIVSWNMSTCEASYRESVTFNLENPLNVPAIAFVTTYEVENVEIPSLLAIVNSTEESLEHCGSEDECNKLKSKIVAAKDAIEGWKNTLQMNKDLKAQAAKSARELIRPHEWFDKIVQPDFSNKNVDTRDWEFKSGLAPSEHLSKAKLRERYQDSRSSSTSDLGKINTIRFSGGSTFSYELNQNTIEKHVEMLGESGDNYDASRKHGGVLHEDVTVGIISVEADGYALAISKESASHTLEKRGTAKTAIGFTLSDPNIGDIFDVDVFIDPKFGTFVFHTRGGASMCPQEPGTDARIVPRLEVISYPPHIVFPDRPMIFELRITNAGNFPGSFVLNYENLNAVYGGLTFYRILPIQYDRIEPGESILTTFVINRGPNEYVYPPLALKLQSACEAGQDLKLAALGGVDQVVVPLFNQEVNNEKKLVYVQPCPAIYLAGDISKTQTFSVTLSSHSKGVLPVIIRNPHSIRLSDAAKSASTRLEHVQLQYRRISSPQWAIGKQRVDNKFVDIDFSKEGLEDEFGFISIDWALEDLGDGDFEFQVVSTCSKILNAPNEFNWFATEVIKGTVDRTLPKPFGIPTPFEKLEYDEDIQVKFNKRLQCSEPFGFDVTVKVDGEETAFTNKDLIILCDDRTIAVMFDASETDASRFVGKRLHMNIVNVSDSHGNVMEGVVSYEAEIIPVSLERRRLQETRSKVTDLLDNVDQILSVQSKKDENIEEIETLKSKVYELQSSQSLRYLGEVTLTFVAFLLIALCGCRPKTSRYQQAMEIQPEAYYDTSSYQPPDIDTDAKERDSFVSRHSSLRACSITSDTSEGSGVRQRTRASTETSGYSAKV